MYVNINYGKSFGTHWHRLRGALIDVVGGVGAGGDVPQGVGH